MVFCTWLKWILCTPLTRIRICLRRIRMRQLKVTISALVMLSCFLTLLLYYVYRRGIIGPSRPSGKVRVFKFYGEMGHIPLHEVYKITTDDDDEDYIDHSYDYIVNTNGCRIPMEVLSFINATKSNYTCGDRAVFLKKYDNDKVQFTILNRTMHKYLRGAPFSHCCHSFVKRSKQIGNENKTIKYTQCKLLANNEIITLESDFIRIRCYGIIQVNDSMVMYDDIFGFAKKINTDTNKKKLNLKVNVLMIGVDSISFSRLFYNMPRSMRFLTENKWLAYTGYHKVEDNTYPNIMAALTGKDISSIHHLCVNGMDKCNDIMLWSKFRKSGHVTAYGEDYLRLPDTFSGHNAFRKKPTDHFLKPLFLSGERELGNGSIVCAGKALSARQVLDYALDFVVTYREDSFFGFFWINSHSHHLNGSPLDLDRTMENFLFELGYTLVLRNTFVVFSSDHGIRFGPQRMEMASYYDERLPVLFIWIPPVYRYKFPEHYDNAVINQRRLATPYDVFKTLYDINERIFNNSDGNRTKKCDHCQSLFQEISPNRTCEDAGISKKWCGCHKMYRLDQTDSDGYKTVLFVIDHIRTMSQHIRTKPCYRCSRFSLIKIIRVHYYYGENRSNLYHIVAFTLRPGNISYEATVLKQNVSQLVGPVSVISPYEGLDNCVIHLRDRSYCACQKVEQCSNS